MDRGSIVFIKYGVAAEDSICFSILSCTVGR